MLASAYAGASTIASETEGLTVLTASEARVSIVTRETIGMTLSITPDTKEATFACGIVGKTVFVTPDAGVATIGKTSEMPRWVDTVATSCMSMQLTLVALLMVVIDMSSMTWTAVAVSTTGLEVTAVTPEESPSGGCDGLVVRKPVTS
jgi:hypothetical protein